MGWLPPSASKSINQAPIPLASEWAKHPMKLKDKMRDKHEKRY